MSLLLPWILKPLKKSFSIEKTETEARPSFCADQKINSPKEEGLITQARHIEIRRIFDIFYFTKVEPCPQNFKPDKT